MSNDRQNRAARAEQMRREREKADRKQRNLITAGIVTVVIVLISIGGYAVKSASNDNKKNTTVVQPANATDDYGVVYDSVAAGGTQTAGTTPVQVELYEDFQCPVCKAFEQANGDFLDRQVEAGTISIIYKPFSFLDEVGGSPNRYSHRATNAALCVLADGGVPAYKKMHDLLYEKQPEERTDGPEDDELIDRAKEVGVTGIDSCVDTEKYVPWIDKAKSVAAGAGIRRTPTVLVDGQEVQNPSGGAPQINDLQAAIDSAQS